MCVASQNRAARADQADFRSRMARVRLDTLLAERGLFSSRSRAAASVAAGEVLVGPEQRLASRPAQLVAADVAVVGRGGGAVRLARRA